jgi:parallel beta-helix repeat protein
MQADIFSDICSELIRISDNIYNKQRMKKFVNYMITMFLIVCSSSLSAQSVYTVTLTSDAASGSGLPGQLRWAIESANANLGESIINFNIPGPGPYQINIVRQLPSITRTVLIDGTSQPGYNFNNPGNPVVIIRSATTDHTFDFDNCKAGKITGLYIKQAQYAIHLISSSNIEIINNVITNMGHACIYIENSNYNIIKGNYLNVTSSLTSTGADGSIGIWIRTSSDNIIGGQNCGEGNFIGYNSSKGIANTDATDLRNRFSGNITFENDYLSGVRFEIGSGGVGNGGKLPPVITSTSGCVVSGTAVADDIVELFGSTGPATRRTNARSYLGFTRASGNGQWSIPVSNNSYAFVMATATDGSNNSSELCTVSAITPDAFAPVIKTPTQLCAKQKLAFEVDGITCKNGLTYAWDYGDGTASTSSFEHWYAYNGTFTIKLYIYSKNNCQPTIITKNVNVENCSVFDCSPCNFLPISNASTADGYKSVVLALGQGGLPPYTAKVTFSCIDPNEPPVVNISTTLTQLSVGVNMKLPTPTTDCKVTIKITDARGCSDYRTF